MKKIHLSIATEDYDHFRDFRSGAVQAEGIEHTWLSPELHEIFARFTFNREWDVSELSFAKFSTQVTRKNPDIIDFARDVAEKLQIAGPANIQCKWDGRDVSLIEVNPRFSGGIPLTIAAGADFATWLVQLTAGTEVKPQIGKFQDALAMMSFEESIFATESELKMTSTEKPRMLSKARAAYVN